MVFSVELDKVSDVGPNRLGLVGINIVLDIEAITFCNDLQLYFYLSLFSTKRTNTRDAEASLGYSDRFTCCNDCPSTSASVIRSNVDIEWPVHSFMVSFHDL